MSALPHTALPVPDVEAMARAVRAFLLAAGVDPDGGEVRGTGERVAAAWAEEFLAGYRSDPYEVLGAGFPSEHRGGVVTLRDIDFVSSCPHHLLPYRGVAHVSYVPEGRVAGFSEIVKLLDCLARRLVLQENVTHEVVEVLMRGLGARGAACVTVAEQPCMTLRGVRRASARIVCRAHGGVFETDASLRAAVAP